MASVHPHPCADQGTPLGQASQVVGPDVFLHQDAGLECIFRFLGKNGHDAIAQVLIDEAMIGLDNGAQSSVESIDKTEIFFGRHFFRQTRKITDIGKQHRYFFLRLVAQLYVDDALSPQGVKEFSRHKTPGCGVNAVQIEVGIHPGQKLVFSKGLGDVIIGAGIEAMYQILYLVFSRNHDHGQFRRQEFFTDLFTYLVATHAGHHHVQQYEVKMFAVVQGFEGILPVECRGNVVF